LLLILYHLLSVGDSMSSRRQGQLKEISPGKWRVRVSAGSDAGGKRVRLNKTIYGSKAEAQRYLNAALRRKEEGFEVALSRQSLGMWIDEWLRAWCIGISPRTKSDYDRVLRRYIPVDLRGIPLPALSAGHIQRWINELCERGLSPRTVRMAHGALRTCLNRAVRVGKITRNTASLVELPRHSKTEREFFTPSQVAAFLEAARASEWGALFDIMIRTGLRPGEALGLQWADWDGSVLRIRRSLVSIPGQMPFLGTTKTCRGRTIPLTDAARDVLREHRNRQLKDRMKLGSTYVDNDLIYPNRRGGFADLHNIVSRHFKPLLKQTGLPSLRLYDLRHSHATILLAAGEHPKVVQERLGHSSVTLTLDTYSHVIPSMQERAGMRFDDVLRTARSETA
jgi:integrase